jgi:predicted metalloendopeptidase
MNEHQADSLGAKPVAPLLAQIDAIRSTADLQKTIGVLHAAGIAAPFVVIGDSDAHNPSFVISQYYNNSLAMPDRDYYLKDDARFKEAREKYLAYMQRLFALAGNNEAQAKAVPIPCCA